MNLETADKKKEKGGLKDNWKSLLHFTDNNEKVAIILIIKNWSSYEKDYRNGIMQESSKEIQEEIFNEREMLLSMIKNYLKTAPITERKKIKRLLKKLFYVWKKNNQY